ncbi:TetR/AcrR family transcriptional regulator [Actinophytocola sediminis]
MRQEKTSTRRHDPRRRERIIEAAVSVISESGLSGLTHRSVALRADVPLGSTTYHFTSLDELLDAAVRTVSARNVARLRDWATSLPSDVDLSTALADFIVRLTIEHRQTMVLAYELYGGALRRPALRTASTAWDTLLTEVFESRVDSTTARALTAMFDGLLYQALVSPGKPRRTDIEPVLRRLLTGPP